MRRPLSTLAIGLAAALALVFAGSPAAEAEAIAGNDIYNVHVEDVSESDGIGTYTITTGGGHSVGEGVNVLYGDGDAWTSFNTIRSYTSATDYVQTPFAVADAGFSVASLNEYGTVSPIGTTGQRTDYVLPGGSTTPDALTIVTDVNVNGVAEADSTVEVTTTVTNDGATPVDIGIRYQWDFQIGPDDGPRFQAENPDGPSVTQETDFGAATFESYGITDDDSAVSILKVHGTVNGPATVTPTPTPPDRLVFGCWPESFPTAFWYDIVPGREVTSDGDCFNDSNVLYYWGDDAESAITLAPGASHTVSQSLFLTLDNETTPVLTTLTLNSAVADVLSPSTAEVHLRLSGRLTETATGTPVSGVLVRFTNDGVGNLGPFDCTGTTNANGMASCGGILHAADAALLGFEYCATSAAKGAYQPASACAPAAKVLGNPIF